MSKYEEQAYEEILAWKRKILKRPKMVQRLTKQAQLKINEKIPNKVHEMMTDAIKNFVKLTLTGSQLTMRNHQTMDTTLEEQDKLLANKLSTYRKTAVIEGAGTGAAGLLVGMADFPLLLSIKMKFLFEAAMFMDLIQISMKNVFLSFRYSSLLFQARKKGKKRWKSSRIGRKEKPFCLILIGESFNRNIAIILTL